jgi:glutaredoxin
MTKGRARLRTVGLLGLLRLIPLRPLVSVALLLASVAFLPARSAEAQPVAVPAESTLQVFVREGCPHCADAKVFLDDLARRRPGLRVELRDVERDPRALAELETVSRAVGVWPPGVPTFVIGGRVLVGFDDADHAGREIVALLDGTEPARGGLRTRWFGTLDASELGLPAFTLALGLIDGFNPCAMWVLLFLLSLLVRLRDRRRMALIAGTFVVVSGLVYYAFMAAWLNVFLVIGMSEGLRWTLAAVALLVGAVNVKDFFAFRRGPSLSIPEAAKPGLYARVRGIVDAPSIGVALAAVTALAVVVNFVELLCTAGLPALYTAVLAQHEVTPAGRYAYLGLYILGYVADDALMVSVAVAALGQRRMTERAGRWLKLASGAVMLALGIVLVLRPHWLM